MTALADTGLLVALLYTRDQFHPWALTEFGRLRTPLLTCEAVLAETAHLVGTRGVPRDRVARLVSSGAVRVAFDVQREALAVGRLLERYADVPMDWADGCLVRMSELHADAEVFTLDRGSQIYRRHRDQPIPTRMPVERR
ncbi:type II toxin-antitoxin system VapC family toxin [Rubrivirga sp.]|uniref:type II toxin-antitoxin system VapC family toxin n=1 Tax=Rubrivirga sp. TaxID=1885344 RepID=UPI003B5256B9